jgi:hypothetical protein
LPPIWLTSACSGKFCPSPYFSNSFWSNSFLHRVSGCAVVRWDTFGDYSIFTSILIRTYTWWHS